MERIIKFWFMQVSRGYSLPMSITNWLVVFSFGILHKGNILYGILALIGFMCAHLGTNVFDDYIDHKLKVPKQEYKSIHLDSDETNLKTILILACIYFLIALAIGIFLLIKCGLPVAILGIIGGIIALFYPISNNYALGEIMVGMAFGPLLFMGVYYVMTGTITPNVIWISIPVAIFTVAVLLVHSLMDFDFDINTSKKNMCQIIGSKSIALNTIFVFMILAYAITLGLIAFNYLPIMVGASFGALIIMIPLYKRLSDYISENEHPKDAFIINFGMTRDIGTIYCLVVAASFFIEKFLFA